MQSNATPHYTWLMNTRNKNGNSSVDSNNLSNNVLLNVNLSKKRLTIVEMHLLGVEIPLTQYNVESLWSRVYFFSGLGITDTVNSSLTLTDDVYSYSARIPITLNEIINVDITSVSAPIFTTQFDHNLQLLLFFDWGDAVRIISGTALLILTTLNVEVLSPTTFRVTGVPPGFDWTAGPSGTIAQVFIPTIKSPHHIADIIQTQLNASFQVQLSSSRNPFSLLYDVNIGSFVLSVDTRQISVFPHLNGISLNTGDATSLAKKLGFVRNIITFSSQSPPFVATGSNTWYGVNYVQLPEANYDSNILKNSLFTNFNRFYLNPSENHLLTITDVNSRTVTISVPSGLYTGASFATMLESLLNLNTLGNYVVQWDGLSQTFLINNTDGISFTLVFDDVQYTTLSLLSLLGFRDTCYSGQSTYISDVNSGLFTSFSQSGLLYDISFNPTTNKLIFQTCSGLQLNPASTLYSVAAGKLNISNATRAHGLAIGDVVRIGVKHKTNEFVVCQVDSAFEFSIDIASSKFPAVAYDVSTTTLTDLGGQLVVQVNHPTQEHCLVLGDEITFAYIDSNGVTQYALGTIVSVIDSFTFDMEMTEALPLSVFGTGSASVVGMNFSLYVTRAHIPTIQILQAPRAFQVKGEVIGFNERKDFVDKSSQRTVLSNSTVNLSHVDYILIELLVPSGTSRMEHEYLGDNKVNIIGKIVIEGISQRLFPMKMEFSSGVAIQNVNLRLLNPDHSDYQLHNENWSATFMMFEPSRDQSSF